MPGFSQAQCPHMPGHTPFGEPISFITSHNDGISGASPAGAGANKVLSVSCPRVPRRRLFGIEKGEFVCIIGRSGCGKSTIMNVLAGPGPPP